MEKSDSKNYIIITSATKVIEEGERKKKKKKTAEKTLGVSQPGILTNRIRK